MENRNHHVQQGAVMPYPPTKLDDVFKFGKYKGKNTTLRQAIDNDIKYVEYLMDGDFQIDNVAYEYYTKVKGR
jgi:hypothetical protein